MFPADSESAGVEELISHFGKMENLKINILNTSTHETTKLLAESRVFCSTAAHYLFWAAEDIERGRTALKCKPPIRNEKNRLELLRSLAKDSINIITSSHFPVPPELKADCKDFCQALGGVSTLG